MAVVEAVQSRLPTKRPLAFVDFNSIGPADARKAAESLEAAGIRYVDAAIHGSSSNLSSTSTVYLSGPESPDLARLLASHFRVQPLGLELGAASRMKMLLGLLAKSMVTVFLEVGIFSESVRQLPAFLEQAHHFYPGLLEAVERMAPTYPRHAKRRVAEVAATEQGMSAEGLRPGAATESRRFLEEIASCNLDPSDHDKWSLTSLITSLASAGVLQSPTPQAHYED